MVPPSSKENEMKLSETCQERIEHSEKKLKEALWTIESIATLSESERYVWTIFEHIIADIESALLQISEIK